MKEVKINSEFIKLDQLLKLADMVGSGGNAKLIIQGCDVLLNGEVETRRGKKIYRDDVVEYNGMKVIVK